MGINGPCVSKKELKLGEIKTNIFYDLKNINDGRGIDCCTDLGSASGRRIFWISIKFTGVSLKYL